MAELSGKVVNTDDFLTLSNYGGVKTSVRMEADNIVVKHEQDLQPVLDACKAMRNENDGYSKTREMRRVMHLPQVLLNHFRHVEGWEPFDPENADRLWRVINDPDLAYLRTAEGNIGFSNGVIR